MTQNTLVTTQQNKLETITLPEFFVQNGKYVRKSYIFTMQNKDEYCQWVQVWKKQYKALSNEIRETKNLRSNAFRSKDASAYTHQSKALSLKENAKTLLEIRKDGKAFIKSTKFDV